MKYLLSFCVTGVDYEISWITKNICYISDRIACTIKVNIKEIFLENDGFLQMFMCYIDCSQRIKDLLLDKVSI